VADGAFGEVLQTRYRVFVNQDGVVSWQLLEINTDKSVTEVNQGRYPTQTEIPIAELVTAGRRAMFDSDPPFLDLAYLNLAHYRQWSDYDTSIHKTCVPILFTAGFGMTDVVTGLTLVVGPNAGINSPAPDGKAEYVTHDGAALAECKASLDDLINRMGALGLAALATSKRTAETATAKEIDKGASDSALAVAARGLQDGLERALTFHARYLGLPDGGSVEVNTNFDHMVMDAATMTAWANLATALGLPPTTVINALIAGGVLPEETDVAALALEMQVNAQAAADQKAQDAAMLGQRWPQNTAEPVAAA
jgi:hypothetical protein